MDRINLFKIKQFWCFNITFIEEHMELFGLSRMYSNISRVVMVTYLWCWKCTLTAFQSSSLSFQLHHPCYSFSYSLLVFFSLSWPLSFFIMHPPRGPKGRSVANRQRGGCISIFAGVFSLNFNTTHTTGYYSSYSSYSIVRLLWLLCLIWLIYATID